MKVIIIAAAAVALAVSGVSAGGEIHGTVIAEDGRNITGAIRWDKNEVFWTDVLDVIKDERLEVGEETHEISILGLKIWEWKEPRRFDLQLSVPFGHLAALERTGSMSGRLTLKNGEVLEVRSYSTDLGAAVRGIEVTTASGEVEEFAWSTIRRIELSEAPGAGRDADRLYGTVEIEDGPPLIGYIVWDNDESLRGDILDGDERDVPFADVQRIRPDGPDGSVVTLAGGEDIRLTGTNDVDADNRGVEVTLANGVRVDVEWSALVVVTFEPAPPSPRYAAFDGGGTISGAVHAVDGTSHRGDIVWDLDERYTWEPLDGEIGELEYAVPFSTIREIRRVPDGGCEVLLTDGTSLALDGSNDVDRGNRGIRVLEDGEVVAELAWEGLDRVVFRSEAP